MGGRENLKQVTSERKEQILGTLEGIYGRVRYLGRKREFGKYKRSNQRIREGILVRYGRYSKTKTQGKNI